MTKSREKEEATEEHDENARGFYVYCIGEPDPIRRVFADSLPPTIETETGLELVAEDKLAAVTSRVPLAIYGEEGLTEHLNDPAWTASRAMRHEQVVEHFAKSASIVPLRFGTIYLERTGIEQMLAERQTELHEILERLREREEWGVNIYWDKAMLMANIAALSPRLRDLAEQAANASPGQSYLMQKKIETMRNDEAHEEINRVVKEVEEALRRQSEGGKRLRVLKVEATEHGELKAKFAFLIERSGFEEFRATAERLARENEGAGVRLELTGPWPAYNFAVEP